MINDHRFAALGLLLDDDLTPEEIRKEIARLAGLYAQKTCVHDAFTILMRIAGALQPGGRA